MVGSMCFNMFEIFNNSGTAALTLTSDLSFTKLSALHPLSQNLSQC